MLLINLSNATLNVSVDFKSPPTSTPKGTKKSKHLIGGHKSKGIVPERQEYHLSASGGDLHSQTSVLNGVALEVTAEGELPSVDIPVVKDNEEAVLVAGLSIVFVVLPDAQIQICLEQLR